MLKKTYLCDNCKAEFGQNAHLNVKSAAVFFTFYTLHGQWKQQGIIKNCPGELHFCNCSCLTEYLKKKVQEVSYEPRSIVDNLCRD